MSNMIRITEERACCQISNNTGFDKNFDLIGAEFRRTTAALRNGAEQVQKSGSFQKPCYESSCQTPFCISKQHSYITGLLQVLIFG